MAEHFIARPNPSPRRSRLYRKPCVVAEIGCNHKGDFEIARELIRLAKHSGARVAKFQKRNVRELLTDAQYNMPHPHPEHAYGETYGQHRERLEFTADQHAELQKFCARQGILYAASAWDATSARELAGLNPPYIKVPSARNTDLALLGVLRDEYRGEIHVSLGMTKRCEEDQILEFFERKGCARDRLVLYACTSGYPVPEEDVALLEIDRLLNQYGARVKGLGFSGHHLGIALDIAAYTLGAQWIERHFTKDRTWKGTDHAASLEPQGLQKLVRDLHATFHALRGKKTEILPIEEEHRLKLKCEPLK